MMKLYDDLYIGIPSGIRIDGCTIGERWTTVLANGNIGMAKTLEVPENPEKFAASFVGAYLRDTANHMRWDTPALASVGVAAMNAWYNTKERADALAGECSCSCSCSCSGTSAAHVGGYAEENVFPLPASPDFDAADYERLRDFDTVIISSEALTAKTLPRLLDIIGERGNVILEGYSLPCSALFFAFGMPVYELRGFYAVNNASNPAAAAEPFNVRRETVEKIRKNARSGA